MNVSLRWLKAILPGLQGTAQEVADRLALRGAPVDEITAPGEGLGDIVVAHVLAVRPHPNADRLSVCEVDGGDGVVQVVCGAPNVQGDRYYPFAPVGSVLPGEFKIKKAKIRGEVSQGMLCSSKELGLGDDHSGLLELPGAYAPGSSFVDATGLNDATLDVEVTANRGDLLSHIGIARELASIETGAVRLPDIPGAPDLDLEYESDTEEARAGDVSVRVEEPALCTRYLGAVVRGVRVGPSPQWLQERLRGAGARPINNVVDATNYVMLEMGQPLHAFDLGKLAGSGIVVRRPSESEERFTTLDDDDRALGPDMLMICDRERPVAVAGVMGGLHSEVDDDTRDILLECAWFEPKSIRATRKALGMSTDASYRFERGVDPEGMVTALERCLSILLAVAGGEVDGPVLDCHPRPHEPQLVSLRVARVERVLGIPFDPGYVLELLQPLGFKRESQEEGVVEFRIPGYRRFDVTREIDIIEEVARTHGFDAFPSRLGASRPGTVPDDPIFQLQDRLRAALVTRGLLEAQTPAFAPEGEGDVKVSNPLAATEPFMRRAVLPALLRRAEYNLARGERDVRLFEIGTSFRKAGAGEPPQERIHVAAVLTGRREPPHWSREDEPFDVWDLKSLLEEIAAMVWGEDVSLEMLTEEGDAFAAGESFLLTLPDGSSCGTGGLVREECVDVPVWADQLWAFEMMLPTDIGPSGPVTYVPLPAYPAIERDLALLVPDVVSAAAVEAVIRDAAGDDLETLELFDVYVGEGVPSGVRSIGFRLRFRSRERTLKDKEVDRRVAGVLERLEGEAGVRHRS